ncbi:angiogenic factor with G patch and FHA domains 1-like [Aethina tumida]|uniref:angiogenic factor with G patch and FHA domains 1-like n=1 Tax=Aethina tumida TaxID=116153 RepID=UPI002148483C|nr:angiogenic factor with G patch and FHA domains 1-like [Aethina tumida]
MSKDLEKKFDDLFETIKVKVNRKEENIPLTSSKPILSRNYSKLDGELEVKFNDLFETIKVGKKAEGNVVLSTKTTLSKNMYETNEEFEEKFVRNIKEKEKNYSTPNETLFLPKNTCGFKNELKETARVNEKQELPSVLSAEYILPKSKFELNGELEHKFNDLFETIKVNKKEANSSKTKPESNLSDYNFKNQEWIQKFKTSPEIIEDSKKEEMNFEQTNFRSNLFNIQNKQNDEIKQVVQSFPISLNVVDNNASIVVPKMKLSKNKWKLNGELKGKLKGDPELRHYIHTLHKYIKKQRKKIKKLKLANKTCPQFKHESVQTVLENSDLLHIERRVSSEVEEQNNDTEEATSVPAHNSGYVYDESSGLYYDYNTGFYYSSQYGLFYNGISGVYYKYNPEKSSYEFHSKVEIGKKSDETNIVEMKYKNAKRRKLDGKETGERTNSNEGTVSTDDDLNFTPILVSQRWPPCMRIMIESTGVLELKVGTLYVITFEGGTLGRKGNHSIIVPDLAVNKRHLKLRFDKETSRYLVTDYGSKNGTFLNGVRLSPPNQRSEPVHILHKSTLLVGDTLFRCHIHEANQTCSDCEPGLVKPETSPRMYEISNKTDVKNELMSLRKKYGVPKFNYYKLGAGYIDRADKRRSEVGSQNPHEKAEVASLDRAITSNNVGFQLMSKMGWKEGESLGKENDGIKEPVTLLTNEGLAGIGSADLVQPSYLPLITENERKCGVWQKALSRFQ